MDAWERGHAAWPTVRVDRARFAAQLTRLADARYVEDLYLATGCAAGMPEALAQLERHFIADVPRFIARVDGSPAVDADIQQIVREHLLIAPRGRQPRIAEFCFRGSLRGWLRVIAVRALLRLRRREPDDIAVAPSAFARLAATGPDPEHALSDERDRREFERALLAALQALGDLDRRLLKLHLVDGCTIDDLAEVFGGHRATVARRLVRLKRRICDEALGRVSERLGLERDETERMLARVLGLLDVSLAPLLCA